MMSFDQCSSKLEFDKVRERLLRYTSSDPGREVIQAISFSTSLSEIQNELSRVSEFKQMVEQEGEIPLEGIHQVKKAIQKASVEGTILRPKDLVQIASTLAAARTLKGFIAKRKGRFPLIWKVAETLYSDKVVEFNIGQAIDESGAVRANASKELRSIRKAIADKYDHLKRRLESILKQVSEFGISQEEIITTREGRMVIPVKAEHKSKVHGLIHSASSSGATVFIEPTETLEGNNEIRSLQFQEQREVEKILRALTIQVNEIREPLLANMDVLARLDALHAKAKYSIEILGVQPLVNNTGEIRLIQARHPVLMLNHGYAETVPLDLDLGDSYSTLVISGPNAGGKTVAMKCVGLLVLMVQAGLHIPASDRTTVRIFKKMFVDIGDEQSIENDLSTFSSHLAHLKEIEEQADSESLVLIDEIGSGTDPGEGGAIAASLLEALTSRKAYSIATTHQGSLKVFAYETDGVENGAMEFDQSTLTPTYRFRSGVPGSSYALEMAARLGISDWMMKRSREFLGHQQTKLENLIIALESSVQQSRKELDSLLEEKSKLDELVRQYEAKVASQAKELKEVKRDAILEAKRIVERANAVIEQSVREIKEKSADRSTVKAAHEEISKFKQEILSKEEEVAPELSSEKLDVGKAVRFSNGGEVGEIESISADEETAVVVFGSVRMKVAASDLVVSRRRETTSSHRSEMTSLEKPESALQDLDLRGMTGEEALPLVDKFLDNAMLAGIHRVDIIHGKGTGALRKKVADFLSHHPRVKSFRLGEWNEGGTGATVVELSDD
ncbi:MAG: endonuclease MutS2 [Ignavibacteria bacterium]|nr:endonuclease MutS2 [Ignavibacteria bacterium]